MLIGQSILFHDSANSGTMFMDTFDLSTAIVHISSIYGGIGTISFFGFDLYSDSTGQWTTKEIPISETDINSGVQLAGSDISPTPIDGIRANIAGSYNGMIEISIQN